jgi:hypothetical protein
VFLKSRCHAFVELEREMRLEGIGKRDNKSDLTAGGGLPSRPSAMLNHETQKTPRPENLAVTVKA